ncbi:hypothetical protein GCM10023094_36870 [Rhodococcus olei]|uniref:Uncharacterized protein n=1 Tax=Rhodococcus olei TaxID=2161675 RepID=A0ABP8P9H3_9NOCA
MSPACDELHCPTAKPSNWHTTNEIGIRSTVDKLGSGSPRLRATAIEQASPLPSRTLFDAAKRVETSRCAVTVAVTFSMPVATAARNGRA